MKDFYLKLYDFGGNLKTPKEKTIIGKSDYFAQINGSFSDCKIKIQAKLNNTEYNIGDFIKIYYGNDIYYKGYIVYIDRVLNNANEYLEFTIISVGNFISNKKITKNYNDTASNIVKDLISECNISFGKNLLSEGEIENINGNIELNLENKSFLEAIQELQKKVTGETGRTYLLGSQGGCYYINENNNKVYVDSSFCSLRGGIYFFIDFDGKVKFGEINQKIHLLTLEKNVSEIKIGNTNIDVVKGSTLSNKTNIKVNNQYNYRSIHPMDYIKIKNTPYKMDKLMVASISYSDLEANISLGSFTSFTNLIKEIGQ